MSIKQHRAIFELRGQHENEKYIKKIICAALLAILFLARDSAISPAVKEFTSDDGIKILRRKLTIKFHGCVLILNLFFSKLIL